ncbi:MAG: FAD/NAD(P)-binding protein [Caldisericia bacterium]|jgi:sulfite reductase subunit B|nr:FAD/NAD(P)-binding protein [Caldisericia bacterium]MDD5688979.1 FAD/NAD(P)-binding protein [Caldisericia bacterium]HOJ16580.1 FAD/NAD(P)-binding protein [Caldisericia bacterium]HOW02740.1 FAD/NAD(P)-binding protein [Caldisericia bacterium]HXK69906.1 FAD/NAD(P)-binding protein [Caldisericia bacterium]
MLEKTIYTPVTATIKSVRNLTELEKLFEIELPQGRLGHKPGQFVQVEVFGVGEAPISVTSPPNRKENTFELCVRKVGNVTQALHSLNSGAKLGIRGPYGTYFNADKMKGKSLLFVAGGIGYAPLRSLINFVTSEEERSNYKDITILYGVKTPKDFLFRDEVEELKKRTDIKFLDTVDKGDETWKGHVGVITTLFADLEIDAENTITVICGPPVMYKFTLLECRVKRIPDTNIIMSLERKMKCGVGKCGHCQINGLYCCQDGPVFEYPTIKELEEAL